MCFVWISEQKAIIFLYSVNWLVFITDTVCVYCAVRFLSLNIITVTNVYYNEMGGAFSVYGGGERRVQGFGVEN
jgi:hypothetical protein